MFKFLEQDQGQWSIDKCYKKLKTTLKTLRIELDLGSRLQWRLHNTNRDEVRTDGKLKKGEVSKDFNLTKILKEGGKNQLALARAATMEGKSIK